MNIKAIIRLTDKGSPTEIKNLYIEELSKGKVPHLDKLLDIQEDSNMKQLCSLQYNNKSFYSYTFCPLELIEIIKEIDQDDLQMETLLRNWILALKDTKSSQDNCLVFIETFKRIIA